MRFIFLTFFLDFTHCFLTAQVQIDKSIQLSGSGANARIEGIKQVSQLQDAVSAEVVQKNSLLYTPATNTGNAYAVSLSPSFSSLVDGQMIHFRAAAANTGAITLNVNSTGAKDVRKQFDVALSADDIKAGQMVSVIFDSLNNRYQLAGGLGSGSGSGSSSGSDCVTIPSRTSPPGYYYTGYKQTFTDEGLWYTSKEPYPLPRTYTRATAYNGLIYVFGSRIASGSSSDNYLARVYNPATNIWSNLPTMGNTMNYERYAIEEVGGKFYFMMGLRGSTCGDGAVWEFNPATNVYTQRASSTSGSVYDHSSAVYNGEIYTFGGQGSCCGGCPTNMANKYNPATNTWTSIASLPLSRYGQVAETVGNKIYIIGGYASGGNAYSNVVYEYNPATNTYTTKAPMPVGRYDMGSVVYNGKIYVFGGNSNSSTQERTVDVYDPASNTWSSAQILPEGRGQMGVAVANNKVYIIGGSYGSSVYNTNWEYSPSQDTGPVFFMHCKQ